MEQTPGPCDCNQMKNTLATGDHFGLKEDSHALLNCFLLIAMTERGKRKMLSKVLYTKAKQK